MNKIIDTILDEARKHETADAVLWRAPSIAPPGYADFSSGMAVFPIHESGGYIANKVVFYVTDTKPDIMHGLATQVPMESTEQEVRELVANAFAEFKKAA